MGGLNETTINGYRLHINDEDVHIHDDDRDLKFVCDAEDFKTEVQEAFDQLKSSDGIYKIEGISENSKCSDLCIVKDGKAFYFYIAPKGSIKKDLMKFVKDC